MGKVHECYSLEYAQKIINALEVLNRDYELKREQEPIEFVNDERWEKVPKPQRVKYTISEL